MIKLLYIFTLLPAILFAKVEGTINGFVRDASNGESMPYVNVSIKDTQLGAATSDLGYYVINHVPPGEYTLIFSMMGFTIVEDTVRVRVGSVVKRDALLKMDIIEMEGIVKTAARERFEREVEVSTTTLTARQLSSLPMLAEADVFRTLRLLPGVVSRNDFSSQLYVRGGSPDQNLVLLDGVTVYNPFHLLGLFSMFNTDAIKEVEFMTGGFPAEYGGRLSSVLSIINNEGNSREFQGKANISMLSAKTTLQGPIPRGSYLISARRTYFDQIFKGSKYDFPYYFYDFQGKINFDVNENHRLTLSGFYGDDKLDYELKPDVNDEEELQVNIDWLWGNRTTSLKWRWLLHPNLFSEVLLTRSRFTLDLDLGLISTNATSFSILNGIKDYSADANFNYFGVDGHSIKFGAKYSWLDFVYSISLSGNELFDYNTKPKQAAIYVQDQWQLTEKTSTKIGVRIENYSLGDRTAFSPRIGAKYQLYPNFALKASAGLYHQFMTTASSDDQNFSFIDLWFPLTENYQPLSAMHYVAGFEWWLPLDLVLTSEFYFKSMDNLLELNENGDFANVNDDYFIGDGYAAGFETLLKRSVGAFSGWVGYSFAATKRHINKITYYPKHDRRHNLNVVLNYNFGKNWQFGFVFTYGTGTPFTPVLGKYANYSWDLHYNEVDYSVANRMGEKNSVRYPAYHRMDISIRKKYSLFGVANYPYLQIINVYNRDNVLLYFWDHDANPSESVTVPMFPMLPTIGIEFEF
jgi:outer membrane cobalamin receptor